MIATKENTTRVLQDGTGGSDTHTEALLNLCDRIGTIASRTRILVESKRLPAYTSTSDFDRTLLHLEARLQTIEHSVKGTLPLLESLAPRQGA